MKGRHYLSIVVPFLGLCALLGLAPLALNAATAHAVPAQLAPLAPPPSFHTATATPSLDAATATPTASATASVTTTATVTTTGTVTPTATVTPTLTATTTATTTATVTATLTATTTATITPTLTMTPTETATATASPTATSTDTPAPTATSPPPPPTPTATTTTTATATATPARPVPRPRHPVPLSAIAVWTRPRTLRAGNTVTVWARVDDPRARLVVVTRYGIGVGQERDVSVDGSGTAQVRLPALAQGGCKGAFTARVYVTATVPGRAMTRATTFNVRCR